MCQAGTKDYQFWLLQCHFLHACYRIPTLRLVSTIITAVSQLILYYIIIAMSEECEVTVRSRPVSDGSMFKEPCLSHSQETSIGWKFPFYGVLQWLTSSYLTAQLLQC